MKLRKGHIQLVTPFAVRKDSIWPMYYSDFGHFDTKQVTVKNGFAVGIDAEFAKKFEVVGEFNGLSPVQLKAKKEKEDQEKVLAEFEKSPLKLAIKVMALDDMLKEKKITVQEYTEKYNILVTEYNNQI